MEEQWIIDRAKLRDLLTVHPDWSTTQLMSATGRSRGWVKKWKRRLRQANPDDSTVLHSRSRRPHHLRAPLHPRVEQAILHLRDHPPAQLGRIAGPRMICYYLHQAPDLKQSGLWLPTSTSTIWKVLDRHQRILRRRRADHEPVERPEPMHEWEIDFADVPTVPADPHGKRQHVVETLNVVDRGTSILVETLASDEYDEETALLALTQVFIDHGLPRRLRMDRDTRWIGSWTGEAFPSPLIRYLLTLGIEVDICPPRRPDLKPFVERFNRTLEYECLRVEQPTTLQQTTLVLKAYRHFYNYERPHQGASCHNRPPAAVFAPLPSLPRLPRLVDPDRWLVAFHNKRFKRRVTSRGTISLDNDDYYIGQALKGRYVVLRLDAHQRQFDVDVDGEVIKTIRLKCLLDEEMLFEDYVTLMGQQARSEVKRLKQVARLRRLRSG